MKDWGKIILSGEFSNETEVQEILTMLSKAIPEKSEQVVTLADRLRYEGRQEGKQEGLYLVAKTMLQAGESIEKVVAYTSLSSHTIQRLKRELLNKN